MQDNAHSVYWVEIGAVRNSGVSPPLSSYAVDTNTDNFCNEDDYIPLSPLQGEKGGGGGGERGHPSSALPPVRSLSSVSGEQLPWYRDLSREKRERTATEGSSSEDGPPDSKRRKRSASLTEDKWSVIWKDLPQSRDRLPKRPHICEHCYKPGHSKRKCTEIQWPCTMCSQVGHDFKVCPEWNELKKIGRNAFCHLCKHRGHNYRNCPSHWRQYHNTPHTTQCRQLDLDNQLRTDRVYCFNCGQQGHFGFECAQLGGRMRKTMCFPLIHKYSAKPLPLVQPVWRFQRSNVTTHDLWSNQTAPPSQLPSRLETVLPPSDRKNRTTHPQSSSIGTPERSQTCMNMELVTSSDEDDNVTYIVLDQVRGDVSSETDTLASPPALSLHDRLRTKESLQRESCVLKKTEVVEMNVKVNVTTAANKTQNSRRTRAARNVLIPDSLIAFKPILPDPSWAPERVLSELKRMRSTMVTNEEQLKRFQEWSGVVTSLCQALSSVMDIMLTCADASWQLQKTGAPRLHSVTDDSLLRQLQDLLKLTLLWMVQEGLRQRRSSEQRALRSVVNPQLALNPKASVYPVQMGLLPRLPELTATNPELGEACDALSLKTDRCVVNDTGSESLSARPCLPASNCDSIQPGSSAPLRRSQRLRSKNPVSSQEVLCGATTNQRRDEMLASIKVVPVAIATKAHETEMKTADQGTKETKDDSLVYDSAGLNSQAVTLESASLDLLRAVDWTYLDRQSTMRLRNALAKRRSEVAGREEDRQKRGKGKGSSALNTTNQAQFRLDKPQRRRIRNYVKELSSYREGETLAREVVLDVLDYTVPWDAALQTLSNLTSVAVKKSQAAVASLKGSVESRMGSTLKQGKEATSSHFSSQLLQRKRGPMPETAPVGKHGRDEAHEVDGLTIPALLPGGEAKRHKPETVQGTLSRSKRKRINRRQRKTFRPKADKTVDQGVAVPHLQDQRPQQHSFAGSARDSPATDSKPPKSGKQQVLPSAVERSPRLLLNGLLSTSVASSRVVPLPMKGEGKLLTSPSTALSSVGHPIPRPNPATPTRPVTLQTLCDLVELNLQPVDDSDRVDHPATEEPQLSKRQKLRMEKKAYWAKMRLEKRQAKRKVTDEGIAED